MHFGFVVVDTESNADAVMEGGNEFEWITLDGPQPDPPKHGFRFRLASMKFGVTWQTEFDIASRAKELEVERKGAQKAAQNLFNAWKKSAKKAGINIRDRLP